LTLTTYRFANTIIDTFNTLVQMFIGLQEGIVVPVKTSRSLSRFLNLALMH
jgi:hypothetical protein